MLDEVVVVSLKRKVRSLETNLLEWRRCACTFTRDLQLVLELSDDDVSDVVLFDGSGADTRDNKGDDNDDDGENDDDDEGADSAASIERRRQRRGKCRVVIDLASELRRVEQKRKHKTRCEIEFATHKLSATGERVSIVASEELMASSTKHCQQFVDQVREFERQAKRKQSMRLGSVLAANAAAIASGSAPSAASVSLSSTTPGVHRASNSSASCQSRTPSDSHPALAMSSHSNKSEEISPACAASASSSFEAARAAPAGRRERTSSVAASRSSVSASSHHRDTEVDTECWTQTRTHSARPLADCESDTLDSSSGVVSPRDTAAATPSEIEIERPRHSRSASASGAASTATKDALALSQLSSASDASSNGTSKLLLPAAPLPQALFAQRLASLRRTTAEQRQHDDNNNSGDDDLDEDGDDGNDDDDVASFETRRQARMNRLLVPLSPSLSRSGRHTLASSRQRRPSLSVLTRSRSGAVSGATRDHRHLQQHHQRRAKPSPLLLRRRSSSGGGASATAASLAANLHRLRLREQRSSNQHHSRTRSGAITTNNNDGDDDGTSTGTSNHAELHILMRVETALRQLEKENALAKERELALTHEVQTLRDALRVQSAEKKHIEAQCLALVRESDEWQHVAQRAERTAAQLEDELAIAREEAQLLHSEKVRLKHQNKELLTHVHRLDSLVYGRFC